jgi:hypothetical protein
MSTCTKWRTDLPSEYGWYWVTIDGGEPHRIEYDSSGWEIKGGAARIEKWLPKSEETFTLHKLEVRRIRLYQSLAKSKENNTYEKVIKDLTQCHEELIDYFNNIH